MKTNIMRVLFILCGGKGKRLGAITRKVPKPLINIMGKPFLQYLIEMYSGHFDSVTLLAGYMGARFGGFGDGKVDVKVEQSPLGTGGALIQMKAGLPEQFFVCNGDTFLHPLELGKFIEYCERMGKSTILLTEGEQRARGSVTLKNNEVLEFAEKSKDGNGHIYAGFCFLRKEDLSSWGSGGEVSIEKDIFPKLAAERKLLGYLSDAKIYDIGTPRGIQKFKELNRLSKG